MEKKYYLHSLRGGLLVGVTGLYVGFILASSSLVKTAVEDVPGCNSYEYVERYEPKADKEERLKALESSAKVLQKTSGRAIPHAIYPALGSYLQKRALNARTAKSKKNTKKKRPKNSISISPTWAQRKWVKAQIEPVFRWPLSAKSFRISSLFGLRTIKGKTSLHKGIDLAAVTGTPVSAALAGKVMEARYLPGYGNTILLSHSKRFKTRYAHLQKLLVQAGQRVASGQLIGTVGTTGHVLRSRFGSSGSHLHFEVYSHGRPVNPFLFLA